MRSPLPPNELERLEALGRYAVMDTRHEPAFDDIARLAGQVCRTPIAQVNFVDRNRVWSKANIGFPEADISRTLSFCTHVIASGEMIHVTDAYVDTRFRLSPLVIQGPRIRFYAGVPIIDAGGFTVGTLCVMAPEPRSLDATQLGSLEALGRQAATLLQSRRHTAVAEATAIGEKRTAEQFRAKGDELRHLVDQMPAAVWATDRHLRFTASLGAGAVNLHMSPREVIGKTLFEFFHTDEPAFPPIAAHLQALRGETPAPMRWSGWYRTFEVHVEPFHDERGEIAGSLGMAMDITERARMERELADAEAKYRKMLDALRGDIVVDGTTEPAIPAETEPHPAYSPVSARSRGAAPTNVVRIDATR
jgi:PAS domain S-box-containing protein